MTDEGLNNLVYTRNVIEFVTVAGEYCSFMEKAGKLDKRDFLEKTRKLLPLLYLKASLLPECSEEQDDSPEKFVSEVEYNILRQRIAAVTGAHDDYQEVFASDMQYSETALTSSISEDLSDIYQDLKDFVSLYRIGNESGMAAGLCECRNNFQQFWGQKLVNCLRAVHQLVFSDIDWEEEQNVRFHDNNEDEPIAPGWLNQKFWNEED